MTKQSTVTQIKPALYTFEKAITGLNGNAILAASLSAINFELSRQVANHHALKMPVVKPETPDDLRDLLVIPELEGRTSEAPRLDTLVNALIASCMLIKDLAQVIDFDEAGRQTRPYAYLLERAITPISAVTRNFEWRADMASKAAIDQAHQLGMIDAEQIGQRAKERSVKQNAERIKYALAEIKSVAHDSLVSEEATKLQEMLIDLDGIAYNGLQLTHNSANASIASAKKRLEQGQFVTVDPELILFAKAHIRDTQPD